MIRLSLIEKLETIIEIIKNSNEAMYVIPIIAFVALLLILISLIKKSFVKYISVFFYIIGLGVLGYFYHEPILNMLDYLVDNIVNNLLFPNLAMYITILLVINVIMLVSFISNKVSRGIKSLNILCFAFMNLLLFFTVKLIVENNIDVYEKLNVYTNQELLVLIEFSMLIFVSWMTILMLIKIIKALVNVVERKRINYSFTTLIEKKETINPNQMVLNYELDENLELIEYVPIKKKEFKASK